MLERILPKAKSFVKDISGNNDVFIDATCGNGYDTKFLAELAEEGYVYSFDIQQKAIDSAKTLTHDLNNIQFILDSHAKVDQYVKSDVKAVMFNLGYLPKGDKSVTTLPDSTIEALHKLFDLLSTGGRIVIVVYHGHPAGVMERDALLHELGGWSQENCQVLEYRFINQQNSAPFIICIEKLKNL